MQYIALLSRRKFTCGYLFDERIDRLQPLASIGAVCSGACLENAAVARVTSR